MALEGHPAPGAVFRSRSGAGTITSTIRRIEPPRTIEWTGRTLGIDAVHVWHLEECDGATAVRTEEAFSGVLARLLRRPLTRTLRRALSDGLGHLKAEAERGVS